MWGERKLAEPAAVLQTTYAPEGLIPLLDPQTMQPLAEAQRQALAQAILAGVIPQAGLFCGLFSAYLAAAAARDARNAAPPEAPEAPPMPDMPEPAPAEPAPEPAPEPEPQEP